MASEEPGASPTDAPQSQDGLTGRLAAFADEHAIRSKGALGLPLVVTDHARTMGLPLDPARLRTEKEGQVLGLGKGKVQQVLARHGIDRVLAEEGGRTSRGSMGKMTAYVALLNELYAEGDSALDLDQVEAFWISRVQLFFAGKPLVMRLDPQASLRTAFRNLFEQAGVRQRETPGTMVVGTVLQHLVGAKLEGAYGQVEHHSVSTKDEGQSRPGDFSIGDLAIHVSTAPGEALIRKCQTNLSGGQRPVILTLGRGVTLATGLAENAGIADRIDVFDSHQWLAASALDHGGDSPQARAYEIGQLLEIYNRIVETTETDPSLKIILATGRV
ncbi:DUF4928 family protein [Brevundimonas variabilis]|uniref:DUF4928 domain-containing protein n=1 Tax=Brevundimonas variabilis TaxID=74312 RepID=A0A7W9FDY8_9CAUL|nr:DUF4928 family protein [Brevundimonas variabilis]MBB5745705.1 hypothetical protein [Brevundimonas variabilis]